MSHIAVRSFALSMVALFAVGCTGTSSPSTGATGGVSSTGGVSQSSTKGTGGTSGTGGTVGSGGATGTGGVSATGGRVSASGGAASGGAPSTGGKAAETASGGSTGTGGTSASGGNAGMQTATGGSASGGTLATGGSASGGTLAAGGGTTVTGGALAAGGAKPATGGAGGSAGGSTGGSIAASPDAGRDVAASAYSCNLVFGNSTTQQWFNGGFLTYPGIDATRWELRAVPHHYIGAWASATDSGWTAAFDGGHACATDAQNPERVIFIVTQAPPYTTAAAYQKDITAIVNNIKNKYSKVKRIELTTLIRSPGNKENACSSKSGNEQSMPAVEDQGIAAVAADPAFAGLVVALPPFYVTACSDFNPDAPQYTSAGATNIAKVYGAYWAANP